jgi:8-oxo-dGTP pyrophosphatase MutT (NUDIX family)
VTGAGPTAVGTLDPALHADALAALDGWVPSPGAHADRQARLRDRFVAHLRARPDGLARSCLPDHLTAGAIVLSPAGDAVLLNLHRKARRWIAFGGHCEPADVSLAGVALREATEESGLEGLRLDPEPLHLDEHAVGFCDPRSTVHHLDVRFGALAAPGSDHAPSDESLDVRWWPVDGLPELGGEMHELIASARARLVG